MKDTDPGYAKRGRQIAGELAVSHASIPEFLFVGFKQTQIVRATDDVRWEMVASGAERDVVADLTVKAAVRTSVPYVVRAYRLSGGVS